MNKVLIIPILCLFFIGHMSAQVKNIIRGRVIDDGRHPLENVNIYVKDTSLGVVTDAEGVFELTTDFEEVTLVISYMSFESQEVDIDFSESNIVSKQLQLNIKDNNLKEVVVTSNKSLIQNSIPGAKTIHRQIAGGTNVVSLKGFSTQRSMTLKDALRLQPGVIIQEFFGANDQPRLNIRGSGIQSNPQRRGINLLQDGITTNLADGSYIIGILEPRASNYIEVFRGANALRYGSATLGGAINLVSKNGYNSSPLALKLEGGSFNYFGGSLSTGTVFGKNDIYASLSYNNSKGFRKYNTGQRLNASFNVGRKFSDAFETRLYATYTYLGFDIPGPLNQSQLDQNPKQINPGVNPPVSIGPNVVRDRPGRNTGVFRLANKSVFQFDKRSKLLLALRYQYVDDTFSAPIPVGIKSSISNDFGANIMFNNSNDQNIFTVGVNAGRGNILRNHFANVKGKKGKQYASNNLTADNLVFYAEDNYKITPKLSGIASVQLSYNSRKNKENFNNPVSRPSFNFKTKSYKQFTSADSSLNQDYFGFNPKLGLIYDADNSKQFFLNISRSYEPPTFDEIITISGGNPNKSPGVFKSKKLEAQTATTLEVGARGGYKKIHWDLSLYNAWVKNEILTVTDLFGISGFTKNYPDQTIHRGLEFGFMATVFENIFSVKNDEINLKTVYNYSEFYFDGGLYKGRQIAGIPRHYISSSLEYKHPQGMFVALNTEWLPEKTPTDHKNTIYQNPYQLFGFRLGYSKYRWSAFLEGKNITDKKYASSYLIRDVVIDPPPKPLTPASVTTFIPGSGISLVIGLNYDF